MENGSHGAIKRQGGPFLGFAEVFSALIARKKLPKRTPTKTHSYVYCRLINYVHAWAHRRSSYAQLSHLYPSLYPYITYVIRYTRLSPAFPYCKQRKAGRGLGTRLTFSGDFAFESNSLHTQFLMIDQPTYISHTVTHCHRCYNTVNIEHIHNV